MNKIMDILNKIEYGWIDKNNKAHYEITNNFSDNYILQSPKEVLKNKIGVCWDQVELERYLYEKGNKYYWFEHSWEKFRGIHEYTMN